jgi:two-component sensor histidine kinase
MVRLSQSDTSMGLKDAIEGGIEAFANVHSLSAQSRWTGAELGSVVKQELSHYFRDGEMRTWIDGPPAMLKPDLAQAIAVVLHELATNAAKFAALSVAKGQVRVEWSRAANGRLVLRSTEAGGPPVHPPTRKGFGTHVMDAMIRGHVGGTCGSTGTLKVSCAKSPFRCDVVNVELLGQQWIAYPCGGVS